MPTTSNSNAVTILGRRYYAMQAFIYMIRRRSDGLFSTGGMYPRFTRTGKVWKNLNTLHNHLALHRTYSARVEEPGGGYHYIQDYVNGIWLLPKQYKDCEIVKCRIEIDEAFDLTTYCKELKPSTKGL